jgi:hypothetical protein
VIAILTQGGGSNVTTGNVSGNAAIGQHASVRNNEDKSKRITQTAGTNSGVMVAAIDSPNLIVNPPPKSRYLDRDAQIRIFSKILAAKVGTVLIDATGRDTDSIQLQGQLTYIFNQAIGMTNVSGSVGFGGVGSPPGKGVVIRFNKSPDAALRDAINQIFLEIGQEFRGGLDTNLTQWNLAIEVGPH